jgi:hypothetical protein
MNTPHRVFTKAKVGALIAAALVVVALANTADGAPPGAAAECSAGDAETVQYLLGADNDARQAASAARSASIPGIRGMDGHGFDLRSPHAVRSCAIKVPAMPAGAAGAFRPTTRG